MESLVTDVRFALRRLWQAPAFTLFAVASLAVGIGVSTAVYSAVRTFLWTRATPQLPKRPRQEK